MNVDTLVLVLAIILMLVGVAGTVLPVLPGVVLVFLTAAAYGWYEGFHQIKANYLMILAGLTLLSVLVSYASAVWGAKYFGSSKTGTWGAVIGVIAGIFFFPPLGIFIGSFLGAVIGEYLELRNLEKAVKAGLGTILGLFSGMVFNLILALGILISFLVVVF